MCDVCGQPEHRCFCDPRRGFFADLKEKVDYLRTHTYPDNKGGYPIKFMHSEPVETPEQVLFKRLREKFPTESFEETRERIKHSDSNNQSLFWFKPGYSADTSHSRQAFPLGSLLTGGCMVCARSDWPHGGLGMCTRCYCREFQVRTRILRKLIYGKAHVFIYRTAKTPPEPQILDILTRHGIS